MKTRFPLFGQLLLWFFLNLLVLLAALWLTLRLEYGMQYRGLLPDTSRPQTQAMAEVLMGDLSKTPRGRWEEPLARLSRAYRMQFALFDGEGTWIAGSRLEPPPEARTMIMMTGRGAPPRNMVEGFDPAQPPLEPRRASRSGPDAGPPRTLLPDFPQCVIRAGNPETYWLLIHLPLDRLFPGLSPMMLVGSTPSAEGNPLLFNPHPWVVLAVAMTIFSAAFWLVLTRSLTSAISEMTLATEAIAQGKFDAHVPGKRSDELGRLGSAINRMAEQLKGFITGQRRFLGDAAHELCSPLARMEVALSILEEQGEKSAAPYVQDMREELTHMRKLAHELLSFTKASLGENRVRLEPVSVQELVDAAIKQESGVGLRVHAAIDRNLYVRAHREFLLRALANLVRNALRYARDDGPIVVTAWKEANRVVISVADTGPGVPAGDLPRLFDPFYRLDESRSSDTGGVGLGLAIVKTCVEACSGSVTAILQSPHGLDVRMTYDSA